MKIFVNKGFCFFYCLYVICIEQREQVSLTRRKRSLRGRGHRPLKRCPGVLCECYGRVIKLRHRSTRQQLGCLHSSPKNAKICSTYFYIALVRRHFLFDFFKSRADSARILGGYRCVGSKSRGRTVGTVVSFVTCESHVEGFKLIVMSQSHARKFAYSACCHVGFF